MKKSIYVAAIIMLFLSACKNDKKQAESNDMQSKEMHMEKEDNHSSMDESTMQENKKMDATTQKNASTSAIIDGYFHIKNALVKDNKDEAAEGGRIMLTAFSTFDMTQLTDAQHKEFMEIVENSTEHAEHIIKSPIDHQREHFVELSNDLNDLITLLGTDKTLYEDFCPMYNNNKGAIWLSETKEIKNPYFGSKMLTCGKIQKQIN